MRERSRTKVPTGPRIALLSIASLLTVETSLLDSAAAVTFIAMMSTALVTAATHMHITWPSRNRDTPSGKLLEGVVAAGLVAVPAANALILLSHIF